MISSKTVHPARRALIFIVLLGFGALNVSAFLHAYRMTHFAQGGEKTPPPERLPLSHKIRVLFTGVVVPKPRNSSMPSALGLNYQTHTFSSLNGQSLEGWFIPAEKPRGLVILFPGYASSKADLLPEARVFHELNWNVFSVDFRGRGGSDGDTTTLGFDEAEDAAAAARFASSHLPGGRVILYGQSMGAVALLRAVSRLGLRPEGVIVEAPFNRLLEAAGNRFRLMGLPPFPLARILIFWGSVQGRFNGFRHNAGTYAKDVRCRALHMHSKDDPTVTLPQAQALFKAFAGEKHWELFQGNGHGPCLAAQPEQWKKAVSRFLEKPK